MSLVWSIIIIGDQPTSILGTKLILNEQPDLSVIGIASEITEGIHRITELKPDLVLVDYVLPEGELEEILRQIKSKSPTSHIVIFTDEGGLLRVNSFLSRGVSGIISQQASPTQLLLLIKGLREKYAFIPLEWLKNVIWPLNGSVNSQSDFQLTEIEILIMERIVRGITYDRIALEIELSRRSIDNYLRRIYVKMDVSTRAQAIEKFAVYSSTRPIYI